MSIQLQLDLSLRLLVALLLGAAIGYERQRGHHPAGLRTLGMVSLGASLFTVAEVAYLGQANSARIAAQVVTGVGFLGAGAIIRQGGSIQGLTSAAAIWVAAAVGVASALGAFILAAACTTLVLITLVMLGLVEHRLFPTPRSEGPPPAR